jgi:hypothetical protein
MTLPPEDIAFLGERHPQHTISAEASMTCVVLKQYVLPAGLNVAQADLLLRLNAGYPDVAPDMWWFNPPVRRSDGGVIPATEVIESHLGQQWQRWSRHFLPGQWRSGIDCLETFMALIRKELLHAAGVTVV